MYRKLIKLSLILVYLVILAGALVRMTGSGMGCPDWPKCFGYYIPPHQISELQFQPQRKYEKGQVIIINESLQVAASDFTSGNKFESSNWQLYTKHDYAKFNALHTWVEYANRLAGALAGLAVLFMAILSIGRWKIKKRITLLSWLSVFLMGFQAWLGATVVFSVLSPIKITVHMIMALVIVAVLLYLLQLTAKHTSEKIIPRNFKVFLVVSVALTLIQIAMGTQVRQFVDNEVKLLGEHAHSEWLANPSLIFYIHRSFSIIVLVTNLFLWWQSRKKKLGFKKLNWVVSFIGIEICTGIAMFYFDFPLLSQPIHLIIASLLFGLQFYILLQAFRSAVPSKSL